jgi:hypothetical protein
LAGAYLESIEDIIVNDIVRADEKPSQPTSMLAVIERAARDPQVDVEKLERLWVIQEKIIARQAEEAFNAAMSDVQAAIRSISADANNNQTRSKYATYAALNRVLRPIYTEHGFSLSFDTGDASEGMVRVLCYVSHKGGHTRTYRADIPADGKGAKGGDVMTKTHAVGSGMSYGMRYLLKMIFNVAIGEDDDDGNGASSSLDSTALDWIETAHGIHDLDEYSARKAEVVKHYGTQDKVPKQVAAAFSQRFRQLNEGKA